jgi:hypothetical protein
VSVSQWYHTGLPGCRGGEDRDCLRRWTRRVWRGSGMGESHLCSKSGREGRTHSGARCHLYHCEYGRRRVQGDACNDGSVQLDEAIEKPPQASRGGQQRQLATSQYEAKRETRKRQHHVRAHEMEQIVGGIPKLHRERKKTAIYEKPDYCWFPRPSLRPREYSHRTPREGQSPSCSGRVKPSRRQNRPGQGRHYGRSSFGPHNITVRSMSHQTRVSQACAKKQRE